MIKVICFTILLFLTCSGGSKTSYYAITAPETLRPNSLYRVFVTVFEVNDPVIVEVTLKPAPRLINENLTAIASISSGKTEEINLQVGNWNHQKNSLIVKGSGGITFRKTAIVKLSSLMFSTIIQTDKGIYTPSQTVYFRIIITTPSLLPHNPNGLVVYIKDPEGNRIKQWTNVTFTHGIYSGKFQLADQINFGIWKISSDFQGQTESVHFTVKEYVLPKFEVIIHLPPFVTWDHSDVTAVVEAKYTNGKPVKGQLSLNVTQIYWWIKKIENRIGLFKTSIDGKAEVKVNIIRDLFLNQTYTFTRNIRFHATVTEALTGKQMNATNELQIHHSKYKLNFSNLSKFKPGLPYTVYLNLVLQDGTPFSDNVHLIMVNYTFYETGHFRDPFSVRNRIKKGMNTMNFSVPKDGRVKIQILPPKSSKSIMFEAKFLDVSTLRWARSLTHPNWDRFIQLLPPSTVPQIGEEVELLLQSTHTLDHLLILQVIGRGKILLTDNTPGNKSKEQIIRFSITEEMAPAVHVIIFTVTNNGLVMVDSLELEVRGLFKTPVSVNVAPKSAKPGTEMEVSVKTNPNAFVALSAVDQSVLLLNKGNDLTSIRILSKLKNIESSYAFDYQEEEFLYPISPTLELFKNTGLLLLTNGYSDPIYMDYAEQIRVVTNRFSAKLDREDRTGMNWLPMTGLSATKSSMPYEPPSAIPLTEDPVHVRSYFPETFLWTNEIASNNGTVHIKTTVPDTITSYYINAFAMDDINGIGLAEQPAKLQIFRPFFVTLSLPYSVVRGETLALQAVVFNYMTENLTVWLTLQNEIKEFSLTNLENEMNVNETSNYIETLIQVKSGEGTSVFFYIVPKKIGYIDLKIAARSKIAADAIHKKLLVKADGIPMYNSKTVIADLRKQSHFQDKIQILIPKNFVDGSEKIEISATRDVMGTAINNIDQLLMMPLGCGEQNMLKFVPNIVIMDYFTATNRLTPQIEDKAIRFMESGYQKELTYKRKDGSFSAFGGNDSKGSTWLTAFVVKSFIQAKKYIAIDENVIRKSLLWLSRQKNADHLFPEVGSVLNKRMQGGSSHGLGLTAYVLSAFLESQLNNIDSSKRFQPLINSSINLLENSLEALKTDYDIVLVTYVLHLANSSVKDDAFEKMNLRSKKDGDKMFWSMSSTSPSDDKLDPFSYESKPKSVDIEMTSYALMTYSLRNMIAEGLPIMRWLLSKQNANGGFQSTQDTVVGIQALAQIAKEISFRDDKFHLDVKFIYEEGEKIMSFTKDNDLVLYREQIPGNVRQIDVQASGSGFGIFQVSWSYNVLTLEENPPFEVGIEINNENNELEVEACVNASGYLYESRGETSMAVMELALPSGYVADKEHLPQIDAKKLIKRVETKEGDSVVVIYFDKIGEQVCVTAKAERMIMIADVKPALIQVYDYYKPEKRGEAFYNPPALSKCDLCQNEECKQICSR